MSDELNDKLAAFDKATEIAKKKFIAEEKAKAREIEKVELDTKAEDAKEGFIYERGKWLGVDEAYWADSYATASFIKWDKAEKSFFKFEDGLYAQVTVAEVIHDLRGHISCKKGDWLDVVPLAKLLTVRALQGIITSLQGHPIVVTENIYANTTSGVVLVDNGRLEISPIGGVSFTPERGRPEDLKSYRLPMAYNPDAKFSETRFFSWLKRSFGGRRDDVAQIAKLLGVTLYGVQTWKKMMYLEGRANTGKTQLAHIAVALLGPDRTVEFDTKNLGEKFEMASFLGKHLCVAPDLSEDALSSSAEATLKRLCAGDSEAVSQKFINAKAKMKGSKMVFAAGNPPLRVRAGVDVEPWYERLVYLRADGQGVAWKDRDNDFAENIISDEGSAILNFAIKGIVHILRANRRHGARGGAWRRTRRQMGVVKSILDSSSSVTAWAKAHVQAYPAGDGITGTEAFESYSRFAEENRLTGWSFKDFQSQADSVILAIFGRPKCGSIARGGRGWRGIRLIA
jgi:hypothetical protein